jgi:hypothetical protein
MRGQGESTPPLAPFHFEGWMISGDGWMISDQETVFLLGSSSLDNHGGLAQLLFFSTSL